MSKHKPIVDNPASISVKFESARELFLWINKLKIMNLLPENAEIYSEDSLDKTSVRSRNRFVLSTDDSRGKSLVLVRTSHGLEIVEGSLA